MSRPLALDLFCCAGGSATGLERAGFDVIGIDHKPSAHWCGAGELHQADLSTADAVEAVIRAFKPDLVSASPPCQAFSSATPTHAKANHPNLIPSTREGITRAGVPGWIENVHGAPLHHAIRLCGVMLPETQRLKRHRFFELIGWWTLEPGHFACVVGRDIESAHGGSNARKAQQRRQRHGAVAVAAPPSTRLRGAMGWPNGPRHRYSLAQAVPPAYAEWLGRRFLESREANP